LSLSSFLFLSFVVFRFLFFNCFFFPMRHIRVWELHMLYVHNAHSYFWHFYIPLVMQLSSSNYISILPSPLCSVNLLISIFCLLVV
jgi:hypothetical protein